MYHTSNSPTSLPLLFLCLLVAGAMGCGESTIDEEAAKPYAADWSNSVEDYLESQAVLAAGSEAIEARFTSAVDEGRRQGVDPIPFEQLIEEVYGERDYEPGLVGDQKLTAQGEAVWKALEQVADHNLDAEPYELEAIEEAKDVWKERRDTVDGFEDLGATDADIDEATSWLLEQPETDFDLVADNYDTLTEALFDDDRYGARLLEAVEEYQDKRGAIAEAAAELEYLLARGLARYSYEQRHFRIKEVFVHPRHWDYYNDPDVESSGRRNTSAQGAFRGRQIWRKASNLAEDMTEENEMEILDERIIDTVAQVLDSDDPQQRVDDIAPQQPQYAGLVDEYRRYRDIVEDGGWEEVERNDSIRPGHTQEVISDLKRRLRIEGYFPDDVDIDDNWDETLTEAIEDYQETHQMLVDGRPNHVFWYSLNIPAERRLEQVGLNLERWRHTNIDHNRSRYAFVNIPDFTIELWEEQERLMRFATIVGDNNKSINPLTDKEEHSNRTPTPLGAYIDRVAFNPYWNVPRRLRAQRILPDVKASIEHKYVLKLSRMEQLAQEGADEIDDSQVTLASIRSNINPADALEASDSDGESSDDESSDDEDSSADGAVDLEDVDGDVDDEELAAHLEDDEEDGPSLDELSDEERQELRDQLMAQKTDRAMATWTYTENVFNEEQDRHEEKRFFDRSRLESLEARLYGGESEEFRSRFPYIDWERSKVDVESTDPDHIPSWYEANDYEVVHPGHDVWEYVREVPNPGNALGLVKIIFPNYDNIYLHDTPEKGLFSSAVRGFSHGCIRLEKPLELSEKLLELDGQLDEVNIDRILRDEDYHPVFLNRHVPIFLEYYTVTIDDDGRANFLADVYGYDSEVWDGADKDPALHQEVNIHPDDRPDPDDD